MANPIARPFSVLKLHEDDWRDYRAVRLACSTRTDISFIPQARTARTASPSLADAAQLIAWIGHRGSDSSGHQLASRRHSIGLLRVRAGSQRGLLELLE